MHTVLLPGEVLLAWTALEDETSHEAGRVLLAALFREKTGRELPPILIAPRGKPYFEGNDLHFSISHTKKHAFCALSPRPVGIDAEEGDRPIRLALADKILSAGERAQFDRAADPRRALLTFWVLKEAAAKRSGLGLNGYPTHTDFSLEDPRVTEIDGCLVAVLTEGD